jgi:hypothetical protein
VATPRSPLAVVVGIDRGDGPQHLADGEPLESVKGMNRLNI